MSAPGPRSSLHHLVDVEKEVVLLVRDEPPRALRRCVAAHQLVRLRPADVGVVGVVRPVLHDHVRARRGGRPERLDGCRRDRRGSTRTRPPRAARRGPSQGTSGSRETTTSTFGRCAVRSRVRRTAIGEASLAITCSHRSASACVATPDATSGLPRRGVALGGEGGEEHRALASLVPRGLDLPGVRVAGVERVEVGRRRTVVMATHHALVRPVDDRQRDDRVEAWPQRLRLRRVRRQGTRLRLPSASCSSRPVARSASTVAGSVQCTAHSSISTTRPTARSASGDGCGGLVVGVRVVAPEGEDDVGRRLSSTTRPISAAASSDADVSRPSGQRGVSTHVAPSSAQAAMSSAMRRLPRSGSVEAQVVESRLSRGQAHHVGRHTCRPRGSRAWLPSPASRRRDAATTASTDLACAVSECFTRRHRRVPVHARRPRRR